MTRRRLARSRRFRLFGDADDWADARHGDLCAGTEWTSWSPTRPSTGTVVPGFTVPGGAAAGHHRRTAHSRRRLDWILSGHLHPRQAVHPWRMRPSCTRGSTERTSFSEADQTKGAVILWNWSDAPSFWQFTWT